MPRGGKRVRSGPMPEPTVGDAANAVPPRVRMKEDGPRAAPPCVRLYALRRFSLSNRGKRS